MLKTNAMRILDARRVAYTVHTYSPDIHSGVGVAEALGVPVAQVFKTLVAMRERGRALLVMLPSDRELDLKLMAATVGEKRIRMASQREAEAKTGMLVGGISALALLDKGFDIFLDASASQFDQILVNGGQRGINLRLRVDDLLTVTNAKLVSVSRSLLSGAYT